MNRHHSSISDLTADFVFVCSVKLLQHLRLFLYKALSTQEPELLIWTDVFVLYSSSHNLYNTAACY